jgi:hypothetical protein
MKSGRHFSAAIVWLLCAAILAAGLTACSSKSSRSMTVASSAAVAGNAMVDAVPQTGAVDKAALEGTASAAAGSTDSVSQLPAAEAALSGQKIIERLNYQIETLKFDDSVARIQSLCSELGGYVQDSNVTGNGIVSQGNMRQAFYTLRVPQEKLAQLKSRAGEIGSVLSFSSSSENVSDRYYDTEARLKSLRTQQDRLLALMQKSGKLEDLIALEKALADVNYQIEELTGTLKQYDSLINYSTVSIQLNEVVQPTEIEKTPTTLWEKISTQFRQSVKGLGSFGESLTVFLLGGSPVILLLLVVAFLVYWIGWGRKHRRGEKRQKTPPVSGEPEQKDGPENPEDEQK